MQPYKPDLVITNCPGCTMFMDKWQYTMKEMEGTVYGENGESIPVLMNLPDLYWVITMGSRTAVSRYSLNRFSAKWGLNMIRMTNTKQKMAGRCLSRRI